MTQCLRWSSDHFYWAVLDAPGVRAANGVPEGVLPILQEDLPVPVEDIHAVGAVGADGKLVICAARRNALREVPAHVLRLSPEDVPAFIEPKIDAAAFNLLVGDFEPVSLKKERGRRTAILTAAAVALACILSVGLSRRAEAWHRANDQARAATATVTNTYSPTAGPLLMQMELDRLRKAPRGDAKPVMPPDAGSALASLLSVWPKELECQTDSVQVSPTTMTLSLTVAKDARPFLSALKPPEGWTMDEPRLTSTGDGSRLHLVLHRKEARS